MLYKKILSFLLLILTIFFITSCSIDVPGDNPGGNDDEDKLTLAIHIWAVGGNNQVYYTDAEIETIKTEIEAILPSNIEVTYSVYKNVAKDGFFTKLDEASQVDIVLAGKNATDKVEVHTAFVQSIIDATWATEGSRYITVSKTLEDPLIPTVKNIVKLLTEKNLHVDKVYNVLFVGNSYTFYNDMYKIFNAVCDQAGIKVKAEQVAVSSQNLNNFANPSHTDGITLHNKLENNTYDYIFIQEQSTRPVKTEELFFNGARNIVSEIGKLNPDAEVILYETWARKEGNSFLLENSMTVREMMVSLNSAYSSIGEELNLRVSHAGLAMYEIYKNHNSITVLRNDDQSHPFENGSYLVALTHVCTLFNFDVRTLTDVLTFNGKEIVTSEVDEIFKNVAYMASHNEVVL